MEETELAWEWRGVPVRIGLTRLGSGLEILLLPALSSISTRAEMWPLQERLARSFSTVAVDWPGFGNQPRPRIAWHPNTYAAFLDHLATRIAPRPFATIAAGHAAGYALGQAATSPGSLGRLCLVAPTWRGPLPTMLGKRHPALAGLARAGDWPVIGPLLYRLNVNRMTVAMMGRGHVYVDPAWLSGSRLAAKLDVTGAAGARHASLRFVAGELDPARTRDEFLAVASRVIDPVLVVFGAGAPRKSRAEMEALAALPNMRAVRLPSGKLSVHEEYPDDVATGIQPFLRQAEQTDMAQLAQDGPTAGRGGLAT